MKTLHVRPFAILALLAILLTAGFAANPGSAQAAERVVQSGQPAITAGTGCSYYVRYGDTLYGIALRYGTTYYQLALMNALYNPNWIYVGQRLNVPCGTSYPPPPGGGDLPMGACTWHIVQPGQYVKQIANYYHASWEQIVVLNHLYNPNLIYPGMKLAIPCGF